MGSEVASPQRARALPSPLLFRDTRCSGSFTLACSPRVHQIANHCSYIIHRKPSARTRRSLVAAAVQWAERIMRKIDRLIMCFLDEEATQMKLKLKLKARVNRSDARTIQ